MYVLCLAVNVTLKFIIMSAGRLYVLRSHFLGHVKLDMEIDHEALWIEREMFIS